MAPSRRDFLQVMASASAAGMALGRHAEADAATAEGARYEQPPCGHWTFTQGMAQVKTIVAQDFAGRIDVFAQKVSTQDFGDAAVSACTLRRIDGIPVAVIGLAFPYTPIANPRGLVAAWRFGIREEILQKLTDEVRGRGAQRVVLPSHNGMDVDLTLASRVRARFEARLAEPRAVTGGLLYRRGNFNGSWDPFVCDALMAVQGAADRVLARLPVGHQPAVGRDDQVHPRGRGRQTVQPRPVRPAGWRHGARGRAGLHPRSVRAHGQPHQRPAAGRRAAPSPTHSAFLETDQAPEVMEGAKAANRTGFAPLASALRCRGVAVKVCEITLKNRGLQREQFIQEADFTPSGVVRLARCQAQGHAYIKP